MRRAFELYRFEGSTLKDIAEELSISIPTAHRLVRDDLRHRRSLIDYAAPLLGSKDDAEDIVQDAYLRFVRETADEHMPPKTYLFRIVPSSSPRIYRGGRCHRPSRRNLSFNKRSRRKLENNVKASPFFR